MTATPNIAKDTATPNARSSVSSREGWHPIFLKFMFPVPSWSSHVGYRARLLSTEFIGVDRSIYFV